MLTYKENFMEYLAFTYPNSHITFYSMFIRLQRVNSLHNDFKDFIEFIGRKAFDILDEDIEVAANKRKDRKMCVNRSGIAFKYSKISFADRV